MSLVDHDTFLKQLTALFEATKEHGSIWLTHKRLTHDGADAVMQEAGPSDTQEYPCLVRVTDGHGARFSTKVTASELIKFHAAYGALLKGAMGTLRKRDKKREKARAEAAARRKARVTAPVVLGEGHKRGKGRRQRQRKVAALLRQQEAQKKHQEREKAGKAGGGA